MKYLQTAAALCLVIACSGCTPSASTTNQTSNQTNETNTTIEPDLTFSKRDLDPSYDEATATHINLTGNSALVEGTGASVQDNTVTITDEGSYIVSGSLDNGFVVVDTSSETKVQVVLAGATIHNDASSAMYVKNADKVFLTLAAGTKNKLSDGENYQLESEDDNRDGTIFSHDDLTINGMGTLEVTGNYQHAIVSKDDLVITGGTLNVTSKEDAFQGKDCIKIADGAYTVSAGDDAFHSDAYFYVKDGTINVSKCYEGYEGQRVIIDGGTHSVTASDDAINAAVPSSSSTSEGQALTAPADQTSQDWAQKSARSFSSSERKMMPGNIEAPDGLTAPDGVMDETGKKALTDINGAGGTGGAAGMGGKGMAQSSENCLIQINGGTLTLTGGADAIDSNGNVEITGGTLVVCGPSKGMDGALDYDLKASITGGTMLMLGSIGSTQGLSDSSQASALLNISGQQGQEVIFATEDGEALLQTIAPTNFSAVFVSSPVIYKDQVFSVSVDGVSSQSSMGQMQQTATEAGGKGSKTMKAI